MKRSEAIVRTGLESTIHPPLPHGTLTQQPNQSCRPANSYIRCLKHPRGHPGKWLSRLLLASVLLSDDQHIPWRGR
ncbi:hypothetical protein P171DRAFT_429558 [Karstenula rhodostoma CBS 690.94]|uniref:Uncharacterized protein n=1 Tax=Karstenula rhodostoma CBS 690.94 TaxID=1392251 RepID=A0A9P4PPW6_9PLEO|nr:hypothetical protein P171DRAFT_429558 [Karstenula rhodostoma CBS 690.94]